MLATHPVSGEERLTETPAWLFRGEREEYPTTCSSFHRFSQCQLSEAAQAEVLAATKRLDFILRERGLHPMYSTALLQHYSLPTEMLDMTSSLDDAAAFAAYRNDGSPGVLMAFPASVLAANGVLIELSEIHFARRPRHQHAYCWFHRTEPDLQEGGLQSALKARRALFQGSQPDLER